MCHGLLYLHLLSIVLYLSTAKRRTVLVLLGQFGGVKYAIQDKIQDNVASSLPSPRVFKFFNTFFFFFLLTRLLREATSQGVCVWYRRCVVCALAVDRKTECVDCYSLRIMLISSLRRLKSHAWSDQRSGWGGGGSGCVLFLYSGNTSSWPLFFFFTTP